jgi:MFS family permease
MEPIGGRWAAQRGTRALVGRGGLAAIAVPAAQTGSTGTMGRVAVAPRGLQRTFASLHDPSFRWFFLSTLGMMGAVMMQILVRGFLVFDLTGSFAALGVLAISSAIPQLLVGFYGGVLADRLPKKTVVQAGQLAGMVIVSIMGLLALLDLLAFWHLLLSGVSSGLLVGLMMPARQAMIHEVVGRERLMNAVSLNTGGMNLMQLLAPTLGGVLLVTIGAGGVFFVMAGCYLFAVVTMWRVPKVAAALGAGRVTRGSGLHDILDGMRYIRGKRPLYLVLSLSFLTSALGMAYMPILPGFVSDVFDGGAKELGIVTSLSAVGAIAGALVLASLPDRHRGALLILSALVLGIGLLAFALASVLWVGAVFMLIVGLGQSGRQSLAMTLLQAHSDDAYRGRVMAVFMMQFSMMSLGAFVMAMLATAVGIQAAFAGLAIGLVIVSLMALVGLPSLRRLP